MTDLLLGGITVSLIVIVLYYIIPFLLELREINREASRMQAGLRVLGLSLTTGVAAIAGWWLGSKL